MLESIFTHIIRIGWQYDNILFISITESIPIMDGETKLFKYITDKISTEFILINLNMLLNLCIYIKL